jgi:hypothetical protein
MQGLLFILLIVSIAVIAVACLAARDVRQRRLREQQRPTADRIADIRADCAMMIRSLQEILDRHTADNPKLTAWIPPVLDYYRRLEALAASPDPSAEDASKLAQEATRHVEEQRLKGVCVGITASQFAKIMKQRDAA